MDSPLQPDPVAQIIDASGAISTDVVCRRCGYNLRGLPPAGRCPECATPIGLSTSGDLLRFADPEWVDKLARGIRYILWGLVIAVLLRILGGVIAQLTEPLIGEALGFLGGLLGLYGAWLLTEPDPSGIGEDRYASARRVIRVTLLVGVAANVLHAPVRANAVTGPVAIVLTVIASLASLTSVVGEFAKLVYLEKLALRIPEPKYAARARFLRWGYGGTLAIVIAVGALFAVFALMAGARGSVVFGGAGCIMAISALLLFVFFLMYLLLLYRMGRAFQEQARIARATWTRAVGAVAQVGDAGNAADTS